VSDEFGAWLAGITKVLERDGVSDVPCGECTACCRASQFVHVGPDELETLVSNVDRRSHQRLGAVAASMRDEAGSVPGSTATHIAIAAIVRFVASESELGRDS